MINHIKTFKRQAAWQKSRKNLSWAEKIRMAEAVRDDITKLRKDPAEKAG